MLFFSGILLFHQIFHKLFAGMEVGRARGKGIVKRNVCQIKGNVEGVTVITVDPVLL